MTYAEVKPVIDEVNDGANREQKSRLHDLCQGEARYRRSQQCQNEFLGVFEVFVIAFK